MKTLKKYWSHWFEFSTETGRICFLLVSSCCSKCGVSLAGSRDSQGSSVLSLWSFLQQILSQEKMRNCSSSNAFSLSFLFSPPRNRREPRRHPAACHLRPGGDGSVQQQAQTEAGPPQPGNRCAHITPHPLKKNPADVTQTYTTSQTLWNTGLRGACVHRRCRFTKHYTCCQ